MSDLRIQADWIEAEELQGPELQSTWCSLSIRIGDSVPTRVFSSRARTVRDEVVLSAYPLAEWIATSWWLLWEQRENPIRASARAFQETHSLRFARDGDALPDPSIVSHGEACHLRWSSGQLDPSVVSFLCLGPSSYTQETLRSSSA